MLFDGAVSAVAAKFGGNGASYGNVGGIKSSGKQLIKNIRSGKGFAKAWSIYSKNAHRQGGDFVLDALADSLCYTVAGSAVIAKKNNLLN